MQQKNSTLAPFRQRNFRNLWTATLASNLGALIQTVAAGWLMISLGASNSMVGLVQSATTLPIVIFSLVAGALADNFNRRQIMISAQVMMMSVSLLLAILTLMGLITPWLLLIFTFLIGCGTALYNPPWQASMGDIVPREDIPAAVTLNSVGFNLMRSVGPAVGGAIIAIYSVAAAFIFNVVSYLPLLYSLLRWKPVYPESNLPRERLVGAMSAGLRYVMMSPNLLSVMVRAFFFSLGAIIILALLPVIASNVLQGSALTYGTLLGCFGLGAILAGVSNSRIRNRFASEKIVFASFIGFAISCLLLAFSANIYISHIVLIPAGLCWVLALSLFNVTVQLSTPRWVVARAVSLYQTASFGGMALGSWVWGAFADSYSPQTSLIICAAFLTIGALIGLRLPIPEIGQIDLDPLNKFREPELRLDLRARSGPIMIMIDYKIAEKDLPSFFIAMTKRRIIRIRDGARNWTLMRDLENPEIWTEAYHVPTWVEYLRHNTRRTKADEKITTVLEKLHQGPDKPHVHRMIERHTVPETNDMHLKPPPNIP